MDFYHFKRVVLTSSEGSRLRARLSAIILPVVHQSKSLSDKRSTPAGGRDLFSSGPNSLDAHAAIRMDDRCASVAVQKLISRFYTSSARIATLDYVGQACPISAPESKCKAIDVKKFNVGKISGTAKR